MIQECEFSKFYIALLFTIFMSSYVESQAGYFYEGDLVESVCDLPRDGQVFRGFVDLNLPFPMTSSDEQRFETIMGREDVLERLYNFPVLSASERQKTKIFFQRCDAKNIDGEPYILSIVSDISSSEEVFRQVDFLPYEPFIQLEQLLEALKKIGGGDFDYKSRVENLVANFVGYCEDENRFYSKDELVGVAIKAILENENAILGSFRSKPIDQEKVLGNEAVQQRELYASVEEFMQENPNCCDLNRKQLPAYEPWLDVRLAGNYRVGLDVQKRLFYTKGQETIDGKDHIFYAISNCGKAKHLYDLL